jgi:hypothetical protein
MFLIIASVGNRLYYYGPYPTRQYAQAVVDRRDDRQANRNSEDQIDMVIVPIQSNDAFLTGAQSTTYQGLSRFDREWMAS